MSETPSDDAKTEFNHVGHFLTQLAGVIKTLREQEPNDPILLAYIGSLASDIVQRGGTKNWTELKASLSAETYDDLLKQCQTKATDLAKRGDRTSAFAVEVIATSVIASRFSDKNIAEGNKLLDELINRSARAFLAAKKPPAN